MMEILIAIAILGGLGLVFGLILAAASKVFYVETDPRLDKLNECLPGANCGGCGYAGCGGYAEAVLNGEAEIGKCASGGNECAQAMAEIMGVKVEVKNDLHICTKMTHLRISVSRDVLSVEDYLTAIRLMELENGTSHSGLSAARLSNDTERLTRLKRKGNVINGDELLLHLAEKALLYGEFFREMSDLKQSLGIKGLGKILGYASLLLLSFLFCLCPVVIDGDILLFNSFTHGYYPPLRKDGRLRSEWG